MHNPCPVVLSNIQTHQQQDVNLQQVVNRNNVNYRHAWEEQAERRSAVLGRPRWEK
jgi:hypothetical protein